MRKEFLIFTDLDGTLLDHYDYKTEDAEETITSLKFHDIAIIPNSSKTCSEIVVIREQLNLHSPFIIENGAAVYIPVGYFNQQPPETELIGDFWVKSFCQNKAHWLDLLTKEAVAFQEDYQGFSQLTDQQLAELTGLSIEQATMAKQRQYGEPLNWLGNKQAKDDFIGHMQKLGANVLQGGRFIHVSGHCDKGQAQHWLAMQYQNEKPTKEVVTIALGDSGNDSAMLEAATVAVQIRSPVHDFPQLKRKNDVYKSNQYGPAGWAECIQKIVLSNLD